MIAEYPAFLESPWTCASCYYSTGSRRSAKLRGRQSARWFDTLVGIANDGRQVGVHVLMSADRPAAVPSALASAVQTRIRVAHGRRQRLRAHGAAERRPQADF